MRRLRVVAIVAALVSAVFYVLIGVGVLDVGKGADGTGPDVLGFGLVAGAAFLLVAAIVAALRRRSAWLLSAVFTGLVIVGYFVTADIRRPPVEPWGLTVKAVQVVLLVALVFLSIRARREQAPAPTD